MRSAVGFRVLLVALLAGGCSPRATAPSAQEPISSSQTPAPAPISTLPAPKPAKIYTVGGEVTEPLEITRVQPRIPDSMQRGLMGAPPMFEAIIGTDGSVSGVHSLRPVPEGARECMAFLASQISQWRYKPATFKGQAVPVYLTVTLFHRSC